MLRSSGSPKLHTFGFGSHFDQQTLNDISEKGGGHCICIQDAEAIPAAFATSLGGLMSINSQNVELSFAPQVQETSLVLAVSVMFVDCFSLQA